MSYIYDLTDTWDDAGTTFSAIKMNVTNTASAAASKLVQCQIGGTDKFTVDKDGDGYFAGNVGIGTTSPATLTAGITALSISDAGAKTTGDKIGELNFVTNDGSFTGTYADGIGAAISAVANSATGAAYGLAFTTATITGSNRAERVRISETGNVGIGTTSPASGIDVIANSGGYFRGSSAGIIVLDDTGVADASTPMRWISSNSGSQIFYAANRNASNNRTTNSVEHMRIDSSGSVGIGTTAPSALLDVAGDAEINGLTFGRGGGSVSTNTASGRDALNSNTTGGNNTASGYRTLYLNTTGAGNTAYGQGALYANTTANYNTAFGRQALFLNTTGAGNTASGYQALYSNTIGFDNTASGYRALYANTTGSRNTASGLQAGYDNTEGLFNTYIGYNTGRGITTGDYNTILGSNVTGLSAGLSNNVIIADGQGNRRINIDSSGNVGIGTTSPDQLLHLSADNSATLRFESTKTVVAADDVMGAIEWEGSDSTTGSSGVVGKIDYIAEDATPEYAMRFFTHDNLAGVADFAERMRIDSSGNVGIGTTSPSQMLTVSGASPFIMVSNTAETQGGIFYEDAQNTGERFQTAYDSSNAAFVFNRVESNGTINERMRIDSSGKLLVGTTTATPSTSNVNGFAVASSGYISLTGNATSAIDCNRTNDGVIQAFRRAGVLVGSITVTSSATAYNTSSDYRLKDIDGPIANSGAYIDALKPVQGSWKADGSRFIGLLAHEVQEVSETQIATGEKDGEEMQAMDYSSPEIIANLIAEIQSLRARVAQLEG